MIRPTVSLIGRQQVEQAMRDLAQRLEREQRVLVGVPVGSGGYEDGPNYATVLAVNNFGSADGRIPAREVLRPAIENGAPMYRRLAEMYLPRVLSGEMEMRTLLVQLGELAEGHVKQEITDIRVPKNADSTIAKKGSDNPLVHDGHLRQSIRYVIDESTDPLEEGI